MTISSKEDDLTYRLQRVREKRERLAVQLQTTRKSSLQADDDRLAEQEADLLGQLAELDAF